MPTLLPGEGDEPRQCSPPLRQQLHCPWGRRPQAINDAVFEELSDLAPTERVAGDDRYGTAVTPTQTYGTDGTMLFIASGRHFPDALAGASYTGSQGAPILLARPDLLPRATVEEIQRLSPQGITILGGPQVVDAGVEADLHELLDVPSVD